METEGFAIYDAMMQLKNEVRCPCVWLLAAINQIFQAQAALLTSLNALN